MPLNIIFQRSFYDGIFPNAWKHAVVIPLYKGKGARARNDTSSYSRSVYVGVWAKYLKK
jgi:hypothetical protein